MNNIFVGNLAFKATREDVIKLFSPFGTVVNAVIMEKKKGKSRGFGFVDMPNEEEKNAAIAALQGQEFMSRVLLVTVVVPKVKREFKPKKFRPVQKEWNSSKPAYSNERESKPYKKFDGPAKPKFYGPKPTGKSPSSAKPPYKKFDGPSKPRAKGKSGSKPLGKPGGAFKMFYGSKSWPKKLPS